MDPSLPTLFERWAKAQSVERPFGALVVMEAGAREQIAESLGIDLSGAWSGAVLNCNFDLRVNEKPRMAANLIAQAEAAAIIGLDGYGLQARSHATFKKLNPAAANHTWAEILHSVIGHFGIPVSGPAPNVEQLESAIYEWVAEKTVETMSKEEVEEMDVFLDQQPELAEKLKKAGFKRSGARLVAAGVFRAAARGGFGTYITAVKAAAFLNRTLGTKLVMSGVTHGLKAVLRATNVILWAWLAKDVLDLLFGASRPRLLAPISEIHQSLLLERLAESEEQS